MTTRRRNVLITDLDQSDTQIDVNTDSHRKIPKRRTKDKVLHTISGNFNGRSHSAEGLITDKGDKRTTARRTGYLQEVVKTAILLITTANLYTHVCFYICSCWLKTNNWKN